MDRQARSRFHPDKANQVFGSGADVVLLSALQPAQTTGETSPPHCSQEPPTQPWGQVTFETAQAQTNSAALQDYWSLERNVQVAISATRTGSTFDLSASGKSLLCISASRFLELCKAWHETLQKCRKSQSRNGTTRAKQMQPPQIFLKMVIYSFSQRFWSAESLMLRSLNCDKGPVVANWVFALITFDVVLEAACQLLESFDYIQVLLQSKQAMGTFLFVCFTVYKWYFLRICSVKEMHSTYI